MNDFPVVATLRYLADLGLTGPVDWAADGYDPDTGRLKRTAAVLSLYRRGRIIGLIVERLGLFAGIRSPAAADRPRRIGRVVVQSVRLYDRVGPDGAPTLRHLRLDAATADRIETFRAAGERWFYVLMNWMWRVRARREIEATTDAAERHAGYGLHVTLLVVDTHERTYHHWDPNGGRWPVYNEATRRAETFDVYAALFDRDADQGPTGGGGGLLAGYAVTGQRSAADVRDTTQNHLDAVCPAQIKFENNDRTRPECPLPPDGLCATASLLVLACCLRFNAGRPHAFDAIVHRHLVTAGRTRDFTLNVAHWHRRLYTVRSWASLERALGLVRRPGEVPAGVRCDHCVDGDRPCPRPPCAASVFCEAHRYRRLSGLAAEPTLYPPPIACDDRAVPWGAVLGPYVTHRPDDDNPAIDVDRTPLADIPTRVTLDEQIDALKRRIREIEEDAGRNRRKRHRGREDARVPPTGGRREERTNHRPREESSSYGGGNGDAAVPRRPRVDDRTG